MELTVERANVNLEDGTIIITGYDVDEIIEEIGQETLLNAMDYSEIREYVAQVERDKADDEYDRNSDR